MRLPIAGIDYTNKEWLSFRNMMIDGLKEKMPQYSDFSDSDAGVVLIELLAKGLDILSYYQDSNMNEVFIATAQQWASMHLLCQMTGYTPKTATAAVFKQVFKLSAPAASPVTIPRGTLLKTLGYSSIEPPIYFETNTTLTIPEGKYGDEKTDNEYDYFVYVSQGKTITQDSIGTSIGVANQTFMLNYNSCIIDSLQLLVNEGYGYSVWNRVSNFVDSTSVSNDYRIEQYGNGTTKIIFGDNSTGKIPLSSTYPILATYKIGGGTEGNVAPNSIIELDESIAQVAETFNPYTAEIPGIDSEDIETVRTNSIAYGISHWSLLTAMDFENYIRAEYREKILLISAVPDDYNLFLINLFFFMKPSYTYTEIKEMLEKDLLERTVPNGELTFNLGELKEVDLTFDLIVQKGYSQTDVKQRVIDFITEYFKLGNINFEEDVVISVMITEIFYNISGIKSLFLDSPDEDVIAGEKTKVVSLGELTVNAIGGIVE